MYGSAPVAGAPAPAAPFAQQPSFASPSSQPAFASPQSEPAFASPPPVANFPPAPAAQFPPAPAAQFPPAPAPAFGGAAPPVAAAADPWGDPAVTEPAPEPAPASADPAALTMNSLSGQVGALAEDQGTGTSLADQAYNKLANLGDFDLVSKKESPKANPFESSSSSIGGQASLADMKAMGKKQVWRCSDDYVGAVHSYNVCMKGKNSKLLPCAQILRQPRNRTL